MAGFDWLFFSTVIYMVFFHLFFIMFVWSYWKTIFSRPANPSKEVSPLIQHIAVCVRFMFDSVYVYISLSSHPPCVSQFCLPKAEKEQYEKEERPESQQEILWRAATNLPLYTRTGAGGVYDTCVGVWACVWDRALLYFLILAQWRVPLIRCVCVFCAAVRYCDRCQVIKPDRCHHCSACDM